MDGLNSVFRDLSVTNTRASAQTVTDHDGIYRQARNNELCWDGLRRVENLLARSSSGAGSEVIGGAKPAAWTWTANSATISAASYGAFADGAEYVEYTITNTSGSTQYPYLRFVTAVTDITALAGEKIAFRIRGAITASSGGAMAQYCTWTYTNAPAYIAQQTATLSTSNQTLADSTYATSTPLTLAGAATASMLPHLIITIPNTASLTVRIAKVQVQKVHGASNLVCGQYVNAITVYNAVVAGVQYSSTTNGNSVASGVLTEAGGAAISNAWTGLNLGLAQINRKTYSENLAHATEWTRTNLTAVDDGTLGPDAVGQLQKLTDDAVNAEHSLYGAADGAAAGTMHTVGFHIKAGTLYGVVLRVGSDTNYGQAEFRFSDMTVVTTASLGTGTYRNAWIERVGLTDIYRIVVCVTYSGSILCQAKVLAAQSAGVTSYVGTSQYCYAGFAGVFSATDSLGPYIPNKATGTTTRQLNTISGTLSGFASNGNITVVTRFKPFYNPQATWKNDWYEGPIIGSQTDGFRSVIGEKTLNRMYSIKYVSGVSFLAAPTVTGLVRLQQLAVCSGLRGGESRTSVNGAAPTVNTDTTVPANASTWGIGDLNGLLQRVDFYRRSMSDAEYQLRSTP